MKIRHPLLIRSAALVLSFVLRAWMGTISFRTVPAGQTGSPQRGDRRGVYLFWHEVLLLPTGLAGQGFSALISRHADGELIAQVVQMLGGHVVRGSTNRSGLTALRGLIRAGRVEHLAITPDGPRGPRRVLQPGAVYLASKTRMPLVPIGFGVRDCWRAKSWDRMQLPKPGTVAVIVIGTPIEVPAKLDRDVLERFTQQAQRAMDEVQRRAEELAKDRRASLIDFTGDLRIAGA